MVTEQKGKLVFFTKYTPAGASSRYRSFQYLAYFRDAGYEVTVHPLIPESYIETFYRTGRKPFYLLLIPYLRRLFHLISVDPQAIIFIEYELFPYLPYFLEKWLLRGCRKIIIDYDDAIFHNYDKGNHLVRLILRKKIYRLVRFATVVITGSPYLTEQLQQHARMVIEIPTSILFEKYKHSDTGNVDSDKENFILGWIGSKTTSYNLSLITDAVKELQQQYSLMLVLIGFDQHQLHLLSGVAYTLYDWNKNTEIALISRFDAGIMPLIENNFNKGKCGFKLIQYMAAGKPTISTPLASNIKINRDNDNLFAQTSKEWKAAIKKMMENKTYYQLQVGLKNQELVARYYSVEANVRQYINIFQYVDKNTTTPPRNS